MKSQKSCYHLNKAWIPSRHRRCMARNPSAPIYKIPPFGLVYGNEAKKILFWSLFENSKFLTLFAKSLERKGRTSAMTCEIKLLQLITWTTSTLFSISCKYFKTPATSATFSLGKKPKWNPLMSITATIPVIINPIRANSKSSAAVKICIARWKSSLLTSVSTSRTKVSRAPSKFFSQGSGAAISLEVFP